MTIELSTDEQRYLLDVFDSSPTDWFLPRQIDRDHFSDRAIDQIVESLVRRGLMDGQTDCHARLTELGRTTAAHAATLAKRDWPKFYRRRTMRVALAAGVVLISLVLVALRAAGVL